MTKFTAFSADTTVFIIDDHPEVGRAVAQLVRSVDLKAEYYTSADDFLESYDPNKPGCLVLDVRMPGMSGLELQKHLLGCGWQIPTIFVTAYAEVAMATEAMRAAPWMSC